MCLAVVTDDLDVAGVQAAVVDLQFSAEPDALHESAVEYAILNAGVGEDELATFASGPTDPVLGWGTGKQCRR